MEDVPAPTMPQMGAMLMPPMGQMMMPYHQQGAMPVMMDKGYGKGVGMPGPTPMPPIQPPPTPLPSGMTPTPQSAWVPNMQMMPIPVPPALRASSNDTAEQRAEASAQKKLNKFLAAMKKEEDTLSPSLQTMAHTMQKKDERYHTKNGDAKEALLEAESARAQLVSQWKMFLQQSVVKWQEFTAQFQASEIADQEKIQSARLMVKKAQEIRSCLQECQDWRRGASDFGRGGPRGGRAYGSCRL